MQSDIDVNGTMELPLSFKYFNIAVYVSVLACDDIKAFVLIMPRIEKYLLFFKLTLEFIVIYVTLFHDIINII